MFKWDILSVEPKRDYTLLITFAKGKKRIFDCKKYLLEKPYAHKLKDIDFFMRAKADHFTVAWSEDLDIAPEYLYENSVAVK